MMKCRLLTLMLLFNVTNVNNSYAQEQPGRLLDVYLSGQLSQNMFGNYSSNSIRVEPITPFAVSLIYYTKQLNGHNPLFISIDWFPVKTVSNMETFKTQFVIASVGSTYLINNNATLMLGISLTNWRFPNTKWNYNADLSVGIEIIADKKVLGLFRCIYLTAHRMRVKFESIHNGNTGTFKGTTVLFGLGHRIKFN